MPNPPGRRSAVPEVSSPGPPDASAWRNPLAAAAHKPVFGIYLGFVLLEIIRTTLGMPWGEEWEFTTILVWIFASATLGVGLARRLPLQNILALGFLSAAIGSAIDLIDVRTAIPFGPRHFGPGAGADWGGIPCAMGGIWFTMVVMCRGIARLILKRHRKLTYYGFWVMGVAAVLGTVFEMGIEPAAIALRWWRWDPPQGWAWYGAPIANSVGWFSSLGLILAFTTPWLLNKQPVRQPVDWHPLLVWASLSLLLASYQVSAEAWLALAINSGIHLAAILLALYGAKTRS
jgi:uncharacterized membrane protein